jgi:tripeptide aminopeptidase
MAENKRLDKVIAEELPRYYEAGKSIQDTLLANLVMVGEIPSPTFGEEARVQFLHDRFIECGLQNVSTDEVGNGLGILHAGDDRRNILLLSHTDTVFPVETDHTVSVQSDRLIGPALGDNALGVAVLATMPTLLEALDIELQSNLILMGGSRSLGRGNLGGVQFFLDNKKAEIDGAICVEGVELGRLSFASIGMLRGEITCTVPDEYDWSRFGAVGAVLNLNEVINRLVEIPLPKRPRASIVFGSVEGGQSFGNLATSASLRFEVRSEADEVVDRIHEQIEDIVGEACWQTGVHVTLEVFSRRRAGGIPFSHPLPKGASQVLRQLEVEPVITPSVSELSALIERDIPAVTLGITHGEKSNTRREELLIEPMFTGLAQLLAVLRMIDAGCCDE